MKKVIRLVLLSVLAMTGTFLLSGATPNKRQLLARTLYGNICVSPVPAVGGYRVRVVNHAADLRVYRSPLRKEYKPGIWHLTNHHSGSDFAITFVDFGEDIRVEFVDSEVIAGPCF